MNAPGFFVDTESGLVAGERHTGLNAKLEQLYAEWESCS